MIDSHSKKYILNGMDCPGCAATIEKYCLKITGVEKAEVNYSASTLKVEYNSLEMKSKLEAGVLSLGFTLQEIQPVSLHSDRISSNHRIKNRFKKNHRIYIPERIVPTPSTFLPPLADNPHEFKNQAVFIFVLLLLFALFTLIKIFFPLVGYLSLCALSLFCLYPILKKVIQYFKVGFYFSVELLMSVAVIGALFIHSAHEAAMVLILFMIGETLEGYTAKKASRGVEKLASLIPDYANIVLQNNLIKQVRVSEVTKNQVLLVKPSERFPADGILIEGETFIDESLLTGEMTPVHKKINQTIYAGSLNTDSSVKILTTQVGKNHSVARLIQLVQDAQGSKSKTLRTIEKFSQYYTPTILILGFLIAVLPPLLSLGSWQASIYKGLAILLIGCPCALIISTPSAIAAGISVASKFGILIKHASALEIIGRVKIFAFDKTGTLTEGKLNVTDIISFNSAYSEEEILKIIAAVEQHSTHPFAKSIILYAKNKNIETDIVTEPKTISGVGVSGKIKRNKETKHVFISSLAYATEQQFISPIQTEKIALLQQQGKALCVLNIDNKCVGCLALQDKLKIGVKEALDNLKTLGIKSIILTGDNTQSAETMTRSLAIKVLSQLLPAQKLNYIRNFSKTGKVAMVGDGINDAPALAAADVGIVLGEGTDVAVDSAQIVVINNQVSSLISAIKISRKTLNIIAQNITIAILLKVLFLAFTLLGDTRLWMAILADTGATVLVTTNSLRLLCFRPK